MKVLNKSARALTLSLAGTCSLTGIADFAHAATTFLGDPVNYSYGTVQVQITVDSANKITQIDTPQVSTRGSNSSYTNYALPILVKEALAAQSANIQGVSGASYLSRGWISSLASAIAKSGSVTTPAAPVTPTPRPTPAQTVAPATGGEGEGFGDDANRPHQGFGEGGEGEGGEHHRGPALPITPKSPAPIVKSPSSTPTSKPSSTPSASPTPVDPGLGLKPGAGVIQKSITCVKGATKKVVKGLNPKCPTGFTLKKP